jgi:tripartite-type tricarboxylate transporter receptor subunit TctC
MRRRTGIRVVPNAINATLYEKLSFNFIRDIAPVVGIVRSANVIAVHPSVPAKTVPEFIAYARANNGDEWYRQREPYARGVVQDDDRDRPSTTFPKFESYQAA